MTLKEWYDDQHPLIQPVIKWTLIFMTIGWIIPMAALITHPSGDPHTDDDGDGYAAANATYYYNITTNTTTDTSFEYATGVFAELLYHFYDEPCLKKDPALHKETAEVRPCGVVGGSGCRGGEGGVWLGQRGHAGQTPPTSSVRNEGTTSPLFFFPHTSHPSLRQSFTTAGHVLS